MRDPHAIIDQLSSEDALAVLKSLAREDDQLAVLIADQAIRYLNRVDREEIAVVLYEELDYLPVEEVWDRAGPKRHGYVDPSGAAYDMAREVVEPFLQDLKKYQRLGMYVQANQTIMGLLSGLCRFETESENEFKDWAMGVSGTLAREVLAAWQAGSPSREDGRQIRAFVTQELHGWMAQQI